MAIPKPHYNIHQIQTGLYANTGELINSAGIDYEGMFHVLPSGQYFSGESPSRASIELFRKQINSSPDVILYNKINQAKVSRYINPVYVVPKLDSIDIANGVMTRYFVQKRTTPRNTIIEIDAEQYNTINTKNYPGINSIIWNHLYIDWIIHLRDKNRIAEVNAVTLEKAEPTFPGIRKYLHNLLEYSI